MNTPIDLGTAGALIVVAAVLILWAVRPVCRQTITLVPSYTGSRR
jgi:hypothetical protein